MFSYLRLKKINFISLTFILNYYFSSNYEVHNIKDGKLMIFFVL